MEETLFNLDPRVLSHCQLLDCYQSLRQSFAAAVDENEALKIQNASLLMTQQSMLTTLQAYEFTNTLLFDYWNQHENPSSVSDEWKSFQVKSPTSQPPPPLPARSLPPPPPPTATPYEQLLHHNRHLDVVLAALGPPPSFDTAGSAASSATTLPAPPPSARDNVFSIPPEVTPSGVANRERWRAAPGAPPPSFTLRDSPPMSVFKPEWDGGFEYKSFKAPPKNPHETGTAPPAAFKSFRPPPPGFQNGKLPNEETSVTSPPSSAESSGKGEGVEAGGSAGGGGVGVGGGEVGAVVVLAGDVDANVAKGDEGSGGMEGLAEENSEPQPPSEQQKQDSPSSGSLQPQPHAKAIASG
eukprot:gnl/Hemi2/24892_TR8371_c0_g2_i2.p1 gnl/Hemi2/24892_TR8371_c0_g2~~gnl/Hemi2/24892_TR8371_c0_g2_i2.p1  ORF type:complete len:393 (+),score=75.63 gnl/Hemi2/24892_TR8371_c0_g2_i2:119-1180(+)